MTIIDHKNTKKRMDKRLEIMHKLYPNTKPTNAEYIRSMTDEELADWYFDKFFPYVPYCSILDECPEHDDCKICLLGWLKQESENK